MQYLSENSLPQEDLEELRKTSSSTFAAGTTLLSTGGRSFVFFYSFYQMLNAAGLNFYANVILSGIFGGGIGSTAQGGIEYLSLDESAYELSGGKKAPSATSFRPVRLTAKAINYIVMATVMLLPYLLTAKDATSNWSLWGQILCFALPAIADMSNTAVSFNESSGNIITGTTRCISPVYNSVGNTQTTAFTDGRSAREAF